MANGRKTGKTGRAPRVRTWKEGFLLALSKGMTIDEAAKAVGIGRSTYYDARHQDPGLAKLAEEASRAFRLELGAKGRSRLGRLLDRRRLPPRAEVAAIKEALREAARAEPKTTETTHTGKVSLDISVEQRVQGALERIEKQQAAIFEGRLGVDKALAAQHKAAKGGNGGNGGNGGGNGH